MENRKFQLLRDLENVVKHYGDLGPLDLKGTIAIFNNNIINDKYSEDYLWPIKEDRHERQN